MIIDTSAIMAILQQEPQAERVALVMEQEPICRISAGSLVELFVVIERQQTSESRRRLDAFLLGLDPECVPVTESQAILARDAYKRYGKGIDPKARLNYGDCFAYALARERNEPLLFVGDDFTHTDIQAALA